MLKIDYCNYKIFLLKTFFLFCRYVNIVFQLLSLERGYALPITSSHDDIS